MGAGTRSEHLDQDDAESYAARRLAEVAKEQGLLSSEVETTAEKNDRPVGNRKSIWHSNIDKHVLKLVDDLSKENGQIWVDIILDEKEARITGSKSDIKINFGTHKKSFSLKNYKNKIANLQVHSGTFHSILGYFLQENAGPNKGKIKNRNKNCAKRNAELEKLGYNWAISTYETFDKILTEIKTFYILGEEAKLWKNVETKWTEDCRLYGTKAIDATIDFLDLLKIHKTENYIKEKILEMSGFNGSTNLIIMDPNICASTDGNKDFNKFIDRLKSTDSKVKYFKRGQSLFFTVYDNDGDILEINVPFTLQKNGAWFLDEGQAFHPREGTPYGERRPKKSKEINTSINTYVYLKKAVPSLFKDQKNED